MKNIEGSFVPPAGRSEGEKPSSFFEQKKVLIESAFAKAVKIFKGAAVDPRNFLNIYKKEKIVDDFKKVKDVSQKFTQDKLGKKVSYAAEAFLYEQVGKGWFSVEGVRVYVERPNAYDDIFNQTDLVLTFEVDGVEEPIAVTVDVSIGPRFLVDKVKKIKEEIDDGTLTTVEYHETPSGEFGPLKNTPRVVFSMEPERFVKDILPLWMDTDKRVNDRLKTDAIQVDILTEACLQLETYIEYAEQKRPDVAGQFRGPFEILKKVLTEKQKSILAKESDPREEPREMTIMRSVLRDVFSIPRR